MITGRINQVSTRVCRVLLRSFFSQKLKPLESNTPSFWGRGLEKGVRGFPEGCGLVHIDCTHTSGKPFPPQSFPLSLLKTKEARTLRANSRDQRPQGGFGKVHWVLRSIDVDSQRSPTPSNFGLSWQLRTKSSHRSSVDDDARCPSTLRMRPGNPITPSSIRGPQACKPSRIKR
jgi:hypothetical protein